MVNSSRTGIAPDELRLNVGGFAATGSLPNPTKERTMKDRDDAMDLVMDYFTRHPAPDKEGR